jgi:hypothetical protein
MAESESAAISAKLQITSDSGRELPISNPLRGKPLIDSCSHWPETNLNDMNISKRSETEVFAM